MSMDFNIGLAMAKSVRRNEGKIAFVGPNEKMTYNQFEKLMAALTLEFKERGVGRESVLGIYTIDSRLALAAVAAANLLGAPWVHGTPDSLHKPSLKVSHVLCSKNARQKPAHSNLIEFESSWMSRNDLDYWYEKVDPQGFASSTDTARIGKSSGTTGAPKFIALTEFDNYERMLWTPELMKTGTTALGCLFPPLSGVGCNSRVRTLLSGGKIVETGIVDKQSGWLSEGVNTIVASPSQYATLLNEMADDPNRRFANALVGGGRPSSQFLRQMAGHFDQILVFYGSTEMGHAGETLIKDVSTYDGEIYPLVDMSVEVQIVDENDVPQPAGVEGLVRLRREGANPKYFPDPLANTDAIRGGWFYPGDLGVKAEDGSFKISGRADDNLNIGGVKINALTMDDVIQVYFGISDGYCFVKPNENGIDAINILVTFKAGLPALEYSKLLIEHVKKHSPSSLHPRAVYVVNAVPRTDTGKPMRRKAAELVETLNPVL